MKQSDWRVDEATKSIKCSFMHWLLAHSFLEQSYTNYCCKHVRWRHLKSFDSSFIFHAFRYLKFPPPCLCISTGITNWQSSINWKRQYVKAGLQQDLNLKPPTLILDALNHSVLPSGLVILRKICASSFVRPKRWHVKK